jgi:hypothetical protein
MIGAIAGDIIGMRLRDGKIRGPTFCGSTYVAMDRPDKMQAAADASLDHFVGFVAISRRPKRVFAEAKKRPLLGTSCEMGRNHPWSAFVQFTLFRLMKKINAPSGQCCRQLL